MTITVKSNPDGISGAIQVNGVDAVPFTANGITTVALQNLSVTPEKLSQKMTLATAVAASGTAIDFTGIPSWVKQITVMVSGLSTSGTSVPIIQLGSGTPETSGYLGVVSGITTSVVSAAHNTGFFIAYSNAAANILHGSVRINLVTGNVYSCHGGLSLSNTVYSIVNSGSKTLSGALDMLRITMVNGTDTFDAGYVNILLEG